MVDEFMSTADAARFLAVHTTTVQRWIRDGRLRAIKVGGKTAGYVLRTADVKALAEARKDGGG